MRKLVSTFIAMILFLAVLSMCILGVSAIDEKNGKCGENVTWALKNGTLTISGTGEMEGYWDGGIAPWLPPPWYNYKDSITAINIKNGVTTIGSCAFLHCKNLESITIPNSVTHIGGHSFYGCSKLESITIPNSVTLISNYSDVDTMPCIISECNTFKGCTSLISINVDAGNKSYSSQDGILFNKDKTILIFYPLAKTETSYTIPDGVISIGDGALLNSSLTSVTIPESVKSIGYDALPSLKDIYYAGKEEQWNEIEVNINESDNFNGNYELIRANIHYGENKSILLWIVLAIAMVIVIVMLVVIVLIIKKKKQTAKLSEN